MDNVAHVCSVWQWWKDVWVCETNQGMYSHQTTNSRVLHWRSKKRSVCMLTDKFIVIRIKGQVCECINWWVIVIMNTEKVCTSTDWQTNCGNDQKRNKESNACGLAVYLNKRRQCWEWRWNRNTITKHNYKTGKACTQVSWCIQGATFEVTKCQGPFPQCNNVTQTHSKWSLTMKNDWNPQKLWTFSALKGSGGSIKAAHHSSLPVQYQYNTSTILSINILTEGNSE